MDRWLTRQLLKFPSKPISSCSSWIGSFKFKGSKPKFIIWKKSEQTLRGIWPCWTPPWFQFFLIFPLRLRLFFIFADLLFFLTYFCPLDFIWGLPFWILENERLLLLNKLKLKKEQILLFQVSLIFFVYFKESLTNYFNVKSFSTERFEISKYGSILFERIKVNKKSLYKLARLNFHQKFSISIGICLNFVMGIYGVQTGTLRPGDLVFLNMLMLQIFGPLFNLGNM